MAVERADASVTLGDEALGSGERCLRCNIPLLVSEGPHCGPRHGDTLNCSAHVARQWLARAGIQGYATQQAERD